MPHADPIKAREYYRLYARAHPEPRKQTLQRWRRANPEKYKAQSRRAGKIARRANKQFVTSLKSGPCQDCGHTFPPEAMDFDHRPGEKKTFNLSQPRTYGKARILAEVKKCDLVCACCHRIRTTKRARAKSLISNG